MLENAYPQIEGFLVHLFLHSHSFTKSPKFYALQWARVDILLKVPFVLGHLVLGHLCLYLIHPWAQPSPQPKRHLDRLSRFCTAHSLL